MSGGLSAMQQKMNMDHVRLSSLETKFLNLSVLTENINAPFTNLSSDLRKVINLICYFCRINYHINS